MTAEMIPLEAGVLAVLTGAPAADVAARLSLPLAVLQAAAQAYRAGGQAALDGHHHGGGWHQLRIDFPDPSSAEHLAVAHLRPILADAERDQHLTRWFFTRKAASWRLRYQPSSDEPGADDPTQGQLADALNTLAQRGEITGWTAAFYEPEVHAFGGAAGMDAAHQLFQADSAAILTHLAASGPGPSLQQHRAEISILLCSLLMRAAGLDWYEQGDVWARLAAHRRRPTDTGGDRQRSQLATHAALRRLMTVETAPTTALVTHGRLTPYANWLAAFHHTGERLRQLSDDAVLQRGLRAVLVQQVLFHWNRLGLPTPTQHTLAGQARDVVLGDPPHPTTQQVGAPTATIRDVQIDTADVPSLDDDTTRRLRNALVDKLRARGAVRTSQVEAALRTVPRHLFLPEFSAADAYADTQIVTKLSIGGTALHSVSHPGLVASMLDNLQLRPGHRVLEIGSGGYNAALLAHLVGPDGQVTTLDIDPEITARSQACLTAAGYHQIDVVTGDGEYGHPAGAPYDRIVVTAGAWDLPPAWFDQLTPDGRLVVPLRLRALSRVVTFTRRDGTWASEAIEFAGFVPMQGAGSHTLQVIPLTAHGDVQLHTDDPADADALPRILGQPVTEAWTGVTIPHGTSYEHLDLWLVGIPGHSRLTATPEAIAQGAVTPTFPWGGYAVHDGATLAYLTERIVTPRTDHQRGVSEVGLRAFGEDAAHLADTLADHIRVWDRDHRTHHHAVIEAHPRNETAVHGDAVLAKEHVRLVLTWK